MTLLDACEPLFQRICELNIIGRTGANAPEYQDLRRELSSLIDSVRRTILADGELERHWAKLEMPILFFVDSMISESALPAAAEWNNHRLAYDYKELAGDEKFYDLLNDELKDPGSDASARLGFYFTCLGLGFTGYYSGGPGKLRQMMLEILRRVDPTVRSEEHLRVSPEAYEHLDTRDLTEPSPVRGAVLLAFFLALFVVFIAVNIFLFQEATLRLRHDLRDIHSHALTHHHPVSQIKL